MLRLGADPARASIVVVALHGRDQTPDYLVDHLVEPLAGRVPDDIGWLLPAAAGGRWYDGRAADPIEVNAPQLTIALGVVDAAAHQLGSAPAVLLGFSQGGCVVAEAVVRRPDPWAGAAILTGTLLGPDPARRRVETRLDAMPIVFGTGNGDPWMPPASAHASAHAMAAAGADVDVVVSPSDEHRIHAEDLANVECLIGRCLPARRPSPRRPDTSRPSGF